MKILIIQASLRKDSLNKKLCLLVQKKLTELEIDFEVLQDTDLILPIYNEDVDKKAKPRKVSQLAKKVKETSGILFISPEYNGGVTGGLKNLIDWVSRLKPNPWEHKLCALMGVSPSVYGTFGNFINLSQVLLKMKCLVYGNFCGISFGHKAFKRNKLVNDYDEKQLDSTLKEFLNYASHLEKTPRIDG